MTKTCCPLVRSQTRESSPAEETKRTLAAALAEVAGEQGMEVRSCCDDALVHGAVGKARCVDPAAVAAVAAVAVGRFVNPTRGRVIGTPLLSEWRGFSLPLLPIRRLSGIFHISPSH